MRTAYQDVEPLEPVVWFERYRKLCNTSIELGGGSPEQLLRQAYHLSVLTPRPIRHLIATRMSESAFEAFLDSGAYDSAALALVGAGMAYDITRRSCGSRVQVELALGNETEASKGAADCLATAFLIAYCGCIDRLFEAALQES